MDVAFVSNVVYPFVTGGAEKRIHEVGTRLVDRGHQVTIYGRHFWDGPRETVHEGIQLRAVSPARDLYVEGGRRSIPEALEFSKDLLAPLRRHADDHDVVVTSVFPYFSVLAAKAALIGKDTPLVTTWHEVWQGYWDEYLGYLAPFGKTVELATAQVPQHPVAVSGVTAARLANLGHSEERIDIVPNGIDFDRIDRIDPASDGFDVLFAGRLIEDKNVDLLLRAFDNVAETHDIQLGVIGDGPALSDLENLAQTLDSSSRVTFLGFLDDYDDVLAHMRAADIFASPSTREGFGITYVEAMTAGCTVIAAEHPDSAASEVVGRGGFTVPPTVDHLSSMLEEVVSGRRPPVPARKIAADYDWDAVTDQAIATYRRATERAHSKSVVTSLYT